MIVVLANNTQSSWVPDTESANIPMIHWRNITVKKNQSLAAVIFIKTQLS